MICVDPSGRITIANAQAERLFGYGREELIGQLIEVLVPESVRGIHPMYRSRYVAEPRPRPMGAGIELAGRRKDGTEFPAEISLSAIQTIEGLLVSAAIRDVSDRIEAQAERERLRLQAERERLERQLHQSQRLESLGQLAGGVAHDFNNLLLVIRNYASFVSEELTAVAEGRPHAEWDVIRSDTQQVIAAADRATRLTHQLLAFGRREVVHPEALSLNDVVTDIEQLLRRTLGEHIQLRTALATDLWRTMADPGQIEQVLVNLAVNARDAMDEGGTLVLETQNVSLADADIAGDRPALTPGRYVELRVSDNGKGMHRDVVDRAFEPFFTTKPKGEGAGLGLATVYGIIAQAGGDTAILSDPGVGTTITALLPATDDVPVANETPTLVARPRGEETILLVEDEEAVRDLTCRILSRNGYRVLVADSGPAALQMVEDPACHPIHLLLTDVVMPRMLGKEVADHAVKLLPDIRVVFMSGYALPTLGNQTLDEGVVLVQKPFTEAVLLNTIREVLNDPD